MKHLIYKTTNNLNGRFYIGMHSTSNEDDGYLGSGRRIKAEVKKYGRENFTREILFREDTREELEDREAQVVNEELLADPLCLNLKNGGSGGGKFWSEEHRAKFLASAKIGLKIMNEMFTPGSEKSKARSINAVKTILRRGSLKGNQGFLGKHHTTESKMQSSLTQSKRTRGENNSQYGTCWVTDGIKPLKIKKEQLAEYLQCGYSQGRKVLDRL